MTERRLFSGLVAVALLVVPGLGRAAAPSDTVEAVEITVLCSNALKPVVEELAPKFESATKHKVVVKYGLAAALAQRIESNEAFDVAFVTPTAMDTLVAHGKIAGDSRTTIGRTGLALAFRAGAPRPDTSTADAFKRALLSAKSIGYVKEGASGAAFVALIKTLGIADAVKGNNRFATGDEVGASVLKGDVEFGVLPVSEILPIGGLQPAPFPRDAQSYIVMVGGVSAASKQSAAARDLLKYLTAPAALPVITAKGMERQN